jgi:hypothetical protein
VEFLEAAIARRLGVPSEWVIATNSCTSALCYANSHVGYYSIPLMTYAATFAQADLAASYGQLRKYIDCDDHGWAMDYTDMGVDLWGRARFGPGDVKVIDAAHRFCAPEHKGLLEAGVTICYSTGPMKELPGFEGGFYCKKMLPGEREGAQAFFNYGQKDRIPTGLGGINGYMNVIIIHF